MMGGLRVSINVLGARADVNGWGASIAFRLMGAAEVAVADRLHVIG
jgi:hypothetical protein